MFHVPGKYRIYNGPMASNATAGNNGAFMIASPINRHRLLLVIASDGMGWEHVSVHAEMDDREYTPVWDEMCFIKDLFWDPEDVVVQYHPKRSEYINNHPNTLHLWRPVNLGILRPPTILVGVK